MNSIFISAEKFIKDRFNLSKDKDYDTNTIDSIKRGVEFRGTNVWVLVFAIFLASVGLNVNSTAVIIGAMLVSPLMGPIMGIGLGVGVFDFSLVKSAAKNLLVMVVISITTSTLYFFVSPLDNAQSELLSRTAPTIWDVLIAISGGLAGIVAVSSKEKGTVIAGVAIATALMPPLCTAGFGLAHANFYFFGGALYLFCINMVFISASTFVVVRLLKFPKFSFVDAIKERKIKRIISVIIIVTVVPSIFIAYRTVQKEVFDQRAKAYIHAEMNFPNTQIIKQDFNFEENRISLLVIGEKLSEGRIKDVLDKANKYRLSGVHLIINQGQNVLDTSQIETLKTGILEKVYSKDDSISKEKDKAIQALQSKLIKNQQEKLPLESISKEVSAINKNITEFSLQNVVYYNSVNSTFDTVMTACLKFKRYPTRKEKDQITELLKARTDKSTLKLIVE